MVLNTNTNYCALYMRTSTKATASQIERSKNLLMAEIEKRSINDGPDAWKAVDFCFDEELSDFASGGSFEKLTRRIEEGSVNCVVVPAMDRLIRSPADQKEFLRLASRAKFRLISIQENIDIVPTNLLNLITAMFASVAEGVERGQRSLRAKAVWKRRRENQPTSRNQ